MRKNSFLIVIAMTLFGCIASAQVRVEYHNQIDSTLMDVTRQFLNMQGVQSLRLTLKGDFDGKRAKINKIVCDKGVFTQYPLLQEYQHWIMSDSVETIDFMAMPFGRDSIRIACFYPASYNTKFFEDTLRIDKMKILMETYTPDSETVTPLIAYTTGLPFQGGRGTWFCGLRDSGVEPRKWFEKYGIDGYVYYVITLEEDTSPNEDTPIYVKIAKKGSYATHIQQ